MINSKKIADALYPIEAKLRILSKAGKGTCYVFAIYDICRTNADKLKELKEAERKKKNEDYQKKRQAE
jgi:hypothetical protein